MMPSATAALVACTASSMRCLRSLASISVAAPTLITATPPASLASRSCSFSRSQSESVVSMSLRSCAARSATASRGPAAVDDRGVVLGDGDPARSAQHLEADVGQLESDLGGDDLGAGDDRQVLDERLAPVAEERRLDRDDREGLADGVDRPGWTAPRPRRPRRRSAAACSALRAPSPAAAAGRPARRSSPAPAAPGCSPGRPRRPPGRWRSTARCSPCRTARRRCTPARCSSPECSSTLTTPSAPTFSQRVAEQVADQLVAGGDGADLRDGRAVAGHRGGPLGEQLVDPVGGLGDAGAQRQRVRAGGDVADALGDDRLGQDRGGGGAVTGDVVGLGGGGLRRAGRRGSPAGRPGRCHGRSSHRRW